MGARAIARACRWQPQSAHRRSIRRSFAEVRGPPLIGQGPFHVLADAQLNAGRCGLPDPNVRPWARYPGLLRCQPAVWSCRGEGLPHSPTDYELSLGKIVDTLRSDYPAIFERGPDFEIYDKHVILELGRPFHAVSALHGKRAYCRALGTLQQLASSAVRDGTVTFHISDGTPYGHALRVHWTCRGQLRCLGRPVHISAISLYSVAPQAPTPAGCCPSLSHLINRHTLEFVEIHPPSLRSLLRGMWWEPLSQPQPALACRSI